MKTSEDGKRMIKSFETLRLSAHLDQNGVPVIGYGHKQGAYIGQIITESEAYRTFLCDVKRAEKELAPYQKYYDFNQNQYDALVSFIFSGGNISGLTAEMTMRKKDIARRFTESALREPDPKKRSRRALERYIFLLEESGV